MPEKPATVAAYAAGASLAAVALFYVFGPNFTIDGDESNISGRNKGIVGLSNPANDCFINSVLQALAGLGELRVYLIRELHRRQLDGSEVYDALPDMEDVPRGETPEKVRRLRQAPVTKALKEMLDGLNERPIYKKTISARGFVQALEVAFQTRISRNQQDAHEFLQVVVERLCEEYHAGAKARERAGKNLNLSVKESGTGALPVSQSLDFGLDKIHKDNSTMSSPTLSPIPSRLGEDVKSEVSSVVDSTLTEKNNADNDFPLEGMLESQIECQHCHYKYKPNPTSFVNLTLQVPQKSSTTLSSCFDGLLKTEFIEDFRCEYCQLIYALEKKLDAMKRTTSGRERKSLEHEISLIKHALENDPEVVPKGVTMPDPKSVPRRKIARHMRITNYPKIIPVHLSRSIFDHTSSTKNAAKVSFPERLRLGGLLDKKWYKLLAIVCHKGSHHSGHYESFRRNHVYAPFSTPDTFRSYAQSRSSSQNTSAVSSPRINSKQKMDIVEPSPLSITSDSLPSPPATESTASLSPPFTSTSASTSSNPIPHSVPQTPHPPPTPARSSSVSSSIRRRARMSLTSDSSLHRRESSSKFSKRDSSLFRRKKQSNERWWKISDEKIKECRINDVLGMQREVYLLFYELE